MTDRLPPDERLIPWVPPKRPPDQRLTVRGNRRTILRRHDDIALESEAISLRAEKAALARRVEELEKDLKFAK